MSEIWYRGEGLGVAPAKAGGVSNDIGDGMYLTDQLEVAKQYAAQRSQSVDDRRVYKVSIRGINMRTLDLTTHTLWKKHISFKINGETIESQLKAGTTSQYSQHFNNYLRANKIDLNQYDAVIGYEYRSGGKQLCVLYKNGLPSAVQVKLRNNFVPIGGQPVTKSPIGALRFNGKIGPGLKFVGGTIATAGAIFLVNWLVGKKIEKLQEKELKRQFESWTPAIERDIRARKLEALKLLADRKPAFAVVRLSLDTVSMNMGPPVGWSDSAPTLEFLSVKIKDKEESGADGSEGPKFLTLGSSLKRSFHKMSFKLEFSQEEIDLYLSFRKEIKWHYAQATGIALNSRSSKLAGEQYQRLKRNYEHHRKEIGNLFTKLYEAAEIPFDRRFWRIDWL